MAKNVETGRATVLKALKMLEPVYTRKPGNFQLQIFFNAKSIFNSIDCISVQLFYLALQESKQRTF